ncbi:MAG: TIGR03757 family integrating conjugative element protein [Gammaproteobacteria bacterium]|nr:TIGR03757 family integrating conjugative element protein [Gammaproteobacteria bacterium]
MRNRLFETVSVRVMLLSCTLTVFLCSPCLHAEAKKLQLIEVFTDSELHIIGQQHLSSDVRRNGLEVRIYQLDEIHHFEVRISKNLPSDSGQARRQALERIYQLSRTDRARLQRTTVGLARAVHYGIDRYPAMVFDGQLVVYGLTDLEAALAHYRRRHRP